MSENASRDALSGRIGLFGRAIRPARSTTRGSEAEIAWKVAFGCFSLTGGKPNGECRLKVIAQRSKELGLDEDRIEELSKGQLVFMDGVRGAVREAGLDVVEFDFMHVYVQNSVSRG